MSGTMKSELGDIAIKKEAIATYVGSVAVSCFGIVGMSAVSVKDGLVHLLQKDNIRHGINVKTEEDGISLILHCIVAYGVNIPAIMENLRENIKYKVEEFTGLTVKRIDVLIEGIRLID